MTARVTDEQWSGEKRARPNQLPWYILGFLSPRLTVPAMRRVVENAGLAGHKVALVIAVVTAFFIAAAIVFIGRIERAYRFVLALLWAAGIFSLWYFTR